jgi:hypothetical protein
VLTRLYPAASVQLFSSVTSMGLHQASEVVARMLGAVAEVDPTRHWVGEA